MPGRHGQTKKVNEEGQSNNGTNKVKHNMRQQRAEIDNPKRLQLVSRKSEEKTSRRHIPIQMNSNPRDGQVPVGFTFDGRALKQKLLEPCGYQVLPAASSPISV